MNEQSTPDFTGLNRDQAVDWCIRWGITFQAREAAWDAGVTKSIDSDELLNRSQTREGRAALIACDGFREALGWTKQEQDAWIEDKTPPAILLHEYRKRSRPTPS